jgi:dipeptidyl-peptidase-4
VTDSFPRQYARTQRFTLGEPRNITVSPDGQRIAFLRSKGGSDPVNCLWLLDIASGEERIVADPRALLRAADEADLPAEERARRERSREGAGGITSYATNPDVTVATFALGGRLFAAGLLSATARELYVPGPVFDPRPDPTARRIAYVRTGKLWVTELDGTAWELAGDDDDANVTWGLAEFIAAEEMGRQRGYWWAPDGEAIAVCRADTGPVDRWHLTDPANPSTPPTTLAYPAAGTDNAVVSVHVLALEGSGVEVDWDRGAFPYVVDVSWADRSSLLVTVQSRDQRSMRVVAADAATGRTVQAFADDDPAWVEIVHGVPAMLDDGRLVVCADRDGARRLLVDGRVATDADIAVRSVVSVDGDQIVFIANPVDDATIAHVYRWTEADGAAAVTSDAGVHSAWASRGGIVLRSTSLTENRATTALVGGPTIESFAETPLVTLNATFLTIGPRRLATAVLLPAGRAIGDGGPALPVLMDPYAGPHALRAIRSYAALCSSQWIADQGFAVVVCDGAGTPGRGSAWEREVHLDLAQPVLDDQVAALQGAAAESGDLLDLDRVGIRGWSFGGYLAALAVIRRPDVFHAAVAGAPVTEWRLYDTHYTERYLGDPTVDPEPYDRSSVLTDAGRLERPLMIIHGLADDNVVAAHTLRLSSALLAAGRPHEVLPLSGVSHMTPQDVVAENLLLLQVDFLRRHLL